MALQRSVRSMGVDPSSSSTSEHAQLTANVDDTRAPAKAAHRFWDTPELVHHLLTFLNADRIDLLATSRISKVLRVQSLKVWARQLDITVSVASDRLKFFKTNLSLLIDVRYLRLRTGRDYFLNRSPRFRNETIRHWHDLNELLVMLSGCPPHTLPVIDVTILPFDLLRLPTVLKQRVVALRILPSYLYPLEKGEYSSSLEHYSSESWDVNEEGEWDLPWAPSTSLRRNHTVAQGCWDRIIDILKHAVQGPGLRAFGIDASRDSMPPLASSTIEEVLRHVGRHASTLLDLRICVGDLSISDFLLSASRFDQLETLLLGYFSKDQLSMIENFLDGLTNVRQLYLPVAYGTPLSLRQTFPHLRLIDIADAQVGPNERRDFEKRHETVAIVGSRSFLPRAAGTHLRRHRSDLESMGYPNLEYIEIGSPEDLQRHLGHGHTPYHICCDYQMSAEDHRRSLTILRSSPEASHRLTCLQLSKPSADSLKDLSTIITSACFPNLTELVFTGMQDHRPSENEEDAWRWLVDFIASLTTAHALRVICFLCHDQNFNDPDILRDKVFPPSLEYVVWESRDAVDYEYVTKTYRFVSNHPEVPIVRTAKGGKTGLLQRVPNAVRTPITKAGVWNRPIRGSTPHTVFDHIGIPTVLLP